MISSVMLPTAGAQESVDEARKEREEVKADRANALRELEAAKLKNDELAELLDYLNVEIATTELAVDMLHRELVAVEAELQAARQIQLDAIEETARLKKEIATIAVAGFVRSNRKEQAFFGAGSLSDAYRQDSLIREANAEPAELLDQVRLVEEEGLLAEAAVQLAAQETIKLEQQLAGQLQGLERDLSESGELKAEFERRVAAQEAKVAERQRDIDELTAYIIANTPASTTGPAVAPPPGDPSVEGYDWPLIGRLSSGFGPRVHPIFGTRRMHTGLDIGGRSGEPIYAAKGGTVISAGWRGGYGNAVVIDHGDGFSTLYAHQSSVAVQTGDVVTLGQVVGYVGSTGWSTAPHLHYELRLNGKPIDPLPYLP
ncbi:MAG: peptidoglycan DD-metalloendopeptidase family protein [Acidimicrobiales bacterium]